MIGIWRLTHQDSLLPKNPSTEQQQDKNMNDPSNNDPVLESIENDIVLRLNDDGSFDPYISVQDDVTAKISSSSSSSSSKSINDLHSLHGVLSRGGCWKFQDGCLILAPDRPQDADPSKVHDTLLTGKLTVQVSECLSSTDQQSMADENNDNNKEQTFTTASNDAQPEIDVHLSILRGIVKMGRFMYPRRHKAFFDEPMLFPESSIGTFSMKQLLGNLNARLKREEEEEATKKIPPKFHKKDFYDRKFYLTSTPHGVNPQYAAQDKHYDERSVKYDVRVMPITFHSNNTFTAIGTEKILRGRFGITGEKGDRLWFQVNMFGFGRSAPGSVYSEGRLLSHDDRRGYVGEIHDFQGGKKKGNQTMYFVDGEFYYGVDLKRTNKAHSWGTFSLQEISLEDYDLDEDNDDDDDDEEEEKEENEVDNDGNGSDLLFGDKGDVFQ
jgi:hypothetical protein